MKLRYFDHEGRQLSYDDLKKLNITTPIMEHVVATVLQRVNARAEEESVANYGQRIDSGKLI